MPYHFELGSEGHSFHGRMIVVNSRTGQHLTYSPLMPEDAQRMKRQAEQKPKFIKEEKKIADEADKRIKAVAGLRKVESETKARNVKKAKEAETNSMKPEDILLKISPEIGKMNSYGYRDDDNEDDQFRNYFTVPYTAFSDKLSPLLPKLEHGDIEVHPLGDNSAKYIIRFRQKHISIYVQPDDAGDRKYVYRDALKTVGRIFNDPVYMKTKFVFDRPKPKPEVKKPEPPKKAPEKTVSKAGFEIKETPFRKA